MRNKLISLSLICSLLLSNANAGSLILEKSSTTSASEWKDPASGITYNNFGSVNFKFKKNVTSFAPWMKMRAPSINAGCGGVSLDAGFAAFLDLETIGKQLEQAASSIGMGVIVVLLQTMPSIGKAFENVQKLIRKIQSMLANSCQSTVNFLKNNKTLSKAKDSMDTVVSDKSGVGWFNDQMGSVVEKMEKFEDVLKCDPADSKCVKNAAIIAFMGSSNPEVANVGGNKSSNGVPSKIENAILKNYTLSNAGQVKADSLKNVLDNAKFDGHTISVDTRELQYIALRIAIFGTLATAAENGTKNISILNDGVGSADTQDSSKVQDLAKQLQKGSSGPTYGLMYIEPVSSMDDIINFLTGEGLTGTATYSVKVPTDLKYKLLLSSTETTPAGGPSGSLVSRIYLEANEQFDNSNNYDITWSGIKNSSYETILNVLDSTKYSAPTIPIGVFMPKGNEYVNMIKKYAEKKDYPKYADLLAKMNVKYAVSQLVREAKEEVLKTTTIAPTNANAIVLEKYLKSVDEIEKNIQEKLKDYSGDVVYLNSLDQIFDNMKQITLQKRLNRAKGR